MTAQMDPDTVKRIADGHEHRMKAAVEATKSTPEHRTRINKFFDQVREKRHIEPDS